MMPSTPAAAITGSPWNKPRKARNSLTNPDIPGNPSDAIPPAKKKPLSTGTLFASPPSAVIFDVPKRCSITPSKKK